VRIKSSLPTRLKYQALVVESAAVEAGLDFFDVVFELLDARDVNGLASYAGFPVRYPSWRFGMEYERLEKGYKWGFSKIYELVINNDPTYAYLVRSNSLLEQKLVMAHVFGHADFFKNNVWFAPTERHMLDVMGNHASRVRGYIDAFGQDEVERFLDRALSIETLIDPYLPLRKMSNPQQGTREHTPLSERARQSLEALTRSPLVQDEEESAFQVAGRALPTYDVLGFLVDNAPLEPWQQDILRIVRREAYYFSPQRMTRIMNEGWASFWHSRLLTRSLVEPSEIVDFADTHSGATTGGPGQVNPYKLGIELYRYAERKGEDIFRLRRLHNDVSVIHKLVDEEFAEQSYYFEDPPLPPPEMLPGGKAPPTMDWREKKAVLLQQLSWGGLPQIELREVGADDELVLLHHHDGRDLQLGQAGQTLRNLAGLWGRRVKLLTLEEGQGRALVCDPAEEDIVALDSTEAQELCAPDESGEDPDGSESEPRRAG
jgi:stage V sporulation protein R